MSDEAERESSLFGRISRGALIFVTGKGFNKGSLFVLNAILTNGIGVSAYGVFTYAKSILTILLTFADLGAMNAILRFVPANQDDDAKQNQILGLAFSTVLVCSLVLAGVIFYFSPVITEWTLGETALTTTLRAMMFAVPLLIFVQVIATVFRSINLPEYQVLLSSICRPGFQLVVVGGAAVLLGTLTEVVIAFVLSGVAAALVGIALFLRRTTFKPTLTGAREEVSEFYNFSLPIAFNKAGSVMYSRADILMVGLFLPSSAVGIYNVAVLVSRLISLPLGAFGQLFPPVISELYSGGKMDEISSLYSRVTRWMFTIALLPGLAVIAYAETVLQIFGSDFTAGASVLVLFSVSQLVNAAVGPSGHLLMMTEHQYLSMVNQWIFGPLNIVLNYVLLSEYGLIGAAVATASIFALLNVTRVVELWHTERLTPYTKAFVKPVIAGVVAGSTMEAAKVLLGGYLLPVVGTSIGGVFFVAVLYVLGIEQEDVEFFEDVLPVG
ncbi:oligosaccharide flippase family protein [Halobacterium sp. MBLA0001]|uniref:oligosaccharide flippase family protein n=1 Tax=Halobacterium sp. MBLA0001 TaxID=3413511 RepID=UPI003C7157DD